MDQQDLIKRYNYPSFTPEYVNPWLRFEDSPPVGQKGPDFPLWNLDERATRLSAVLERHLLTVIEFGSFT
jgi:hypothetical protein